MGGGIEAGGRTALAISGTTVAENSASEYGGGLVANSSAGPVTVANSTIDSNFAATRAGGIFAVAADNVFRVAVTSSTISGNSAEEAGGGIYQYRASPTELPMSLTSSIVADNSAAGADNDLAIGGGTPPPFDTGFSLIENPGTAVINAAGPNLLGQDPQLAPLADNGGLTETRLPGLHSPVIDKGNSTITPDQRGAHTAGAAHRRAERGRRQRR